MSPVGRAAASYRCRAAARLLLSLRQASRVGVMWATCPARWSLGLTASPGNRAVLGYSWLKCHISFGEQLQCRPLTDRSGFKSWLPCLLKLWFWTTYLTSLSLNFPIYNRDARVSTSRALWWFWWSDYKALCLVRRNVVSHHCCNYLPETRWLKTIAMYHLTACTSQKSRHSQAPWVLVWGSHKAKIKVLAAIISYLEALGQNSLPGPFRGLEEFRSLCDCRSEVSISWSPLCS